MAVAAGVAAVMVSPAGLGGGRFGLYVWFPAAMRPLLPG